MDKHERGEQDNSKKTTSQSENEKQRRELEGKQNQQLTKEELPDSTNESKGAMGSGQRQDSN